MNDKIREALEIGKFRIEAELARRKEAMAGYSHRWVGLERDLAAIDAALAAQGQAEPSFPDCRVSDIGFRWDSETKSHIPHLLIQFDSVPGNSPCDAKGWKDRDQLAAMLAAHRAQQSAQPSELTDARIMEISDSDACNPDAGSGRRLSLRLFAREILKASKETS